MSLKKKKEAVINAILDEAISKGSRGVNWQMDRLAEESSELIQAVMKVKRYPESKERRDNLYEELAHVKLHMDILMKILGKGSYKKEMKKKVSQLEKTYQITEHARKD